MVWCNFIALFLILIFLHQVICKSSATKRGQMYTPVLQEDNAWPLRGLYIGEISGVSVDKHGNPVILHRGSRKWDSDSFHRNHTYRSTDQGPIPMNVVLTIDAAAGISLNEWGCSTFYLPHSITVDQEENAWITDVAMHQVFKFGANDFRKPELVLGTAFEPGADETHFCKPTGVAVSASGDFYVSDGYCNSRVLRYSRDGQLKHQWGERALAVPHGIALSERHDLLCVADRNNHRLVCFSAGLRNPRLTGKLVTVVSERNLGPVHAAAFSGNLLYGVAGTSEFDTKGPFGFTVELNEKLKGRTVAVWGKEAVRQRFVDNQIPEDAPFQVMRTPHALAVDRDNRSVYVADLNSMFSTLWKFRLREE